MPEEKFYFKTSEGTVGIPRSQVDEFLKDVPDAVEVGLFTVKNEQGKLDTLGIPANQVDDFLKDVPDAKPLSLGKPSAEPSKSTSGKSQLGGGEFGFNQTVGVKQQKSTVQPSIPSRASTEFGFNKTIKAEKPKPSVVVEPQPLTYEVEQSLLPKEEPKTFNDGNIFSDYEKTQSYFSKVDKAKKEIVDNNNFNYEVPNTEEGKQIYLDATLDRSYNIQKKKADAAQKKMSDALNPLIEKDISSDFLIKNDDGFLVPNTYKIDNYAKSVARKYGLPEDGFFKEVVYNEASSMAAFKELEPEINKRFSELITITPSGSNLFKEKSKEYWKGFTTDEIEQAELEKKVDLIASNLKLKSKQDQDLIQSNLTEVVSNLDNSIKQSQAQISLEYQKAEQAYKSGQISYEQYQSSFNAIKQQSDEAYKAYSDERLKLFDEGQKASNQISNRYNAQLRRQTEELQNIANAKVAEAAKKYEKGYTGDPEFDNQIKKLYKKAYTEVTDKKQQEIINYNKGRAYSIQMRFPQFGGLAAMTDRFLRSVDNAAGGSLKGLGTTLGIDSLQLYGDFLQRTVTLPEAKTKEFKDLFDPLNLAQVSGQLAGAMTPTIVASVAAGAATKNVSAMYQMAAIGVASFSIESADIAGRMYDETFARTQSAAQANEASAKSWESQYKIMPLYALSGLPFISTAKTWMGTLPRVARVGLGAAAEVAEEIPQELSQNIAEENIRAGNDPYKDYWQKISEKDYLRLKETTISVLPIALLGGAGQLSGKRQLTKTQELNQQAKSYAAQAKVNEIVGNMQGQWISQMVYKKGDAFAVATINSLFADGTIDQQTRDQLQENVNLSKKNFSDAKILGLNESEGVVYDALTQAYAQKKAEFDKAIKNGDEILSDNLNQEMTNIKNQTKEFAQNKKADFFVFEFADGSQKVVTNSNWSTDNTILDLIKNNEISVSAYSDKGKGLLESLKPKVEVKEEVVTETQPTTESVTPKVDEKVIKEEVRKQRDAELEQIQAIRADLGTDAELIDDLPEAVDNVIDRIDLSAPIDNVAINESIAALDKKFSDLEAYKNNPNRTHTIAQIEAMQDIFSQTKSEIQAYQEKQSQDGIQAERTTETKTREPQTTTAESAPSQQEVTTQTTENAVQEQPTTQTIPRTGEAGQNIPESSQGVRQSEQGKETAQQGKAEVKAPEIILSGAAGGFKSFSKKAFDLRNLDGIRQAINENISFAKIFEYKGKKYIAVGLVLSIDSQRGNPNGRNNYSFAVAEINESTPSNIVETLENSAKENFKNLYKDFSVNDSIEPITTTDVEIANLTPNITTNESKNQSGSKENAAKNENGIQEGGKNGNENVSENVQGKGKDGGQNVNVQNEGQLQEVKTTTPNADLAQQGEAATEGAKTETTDEAKTQENIPAATETDKGGEQSVVQKVSEKDNPTEQDVQVVAEALGIPIEPLPAKEPEVAPTKELSATEKKIQEFKEKLKESIDNVKSTHKELYNQKLGFFYNPSEVAKKQYAYHMALKNVAINAIQLGVANIQQFSAVLGNKVIDGALRLAWRDANAEINGGFVAIQNEDDIHNWLAQIQINADQRQKEENAKYKRSFRGKIADKIVSFFDSLYDNRMPAIRAVNKAAVTAIDNLANYAPQGNVQYDSDALKQEVSKKAKRIFNLMDLIPGAKSYAESLYNSKGRKIFKGLSVTELEDLSRVIDARTVISIDTRFDKKKADDIARLTSELQNATDVKEINRITKELDEANSRQRKKHTADSKGTQSNLETATAMLELMEQNNPLLYKKINDRAEMYFDLNRELLIARKDAGLISNEQFDALINNDYSKRQFLEHILDDGSSVNKGVKFGNKSYLSGDIKSLEDGSIDVLLDNKDALLKANILQTARGIFSNNARVGLLDFIRNNPNNGQFSEQKSNGVDEYGNATFSNEGLPKGYGQIFAKETEYVATQDFTVNGVDFKQGQKLTQKEYSDLLNDSYGLLTTHGLTEEEKLNYDSKVKAVGGKRVSILAPIKFIETFENPQLWVTPNMRMFLRTISFAGITSALAVGVNPLFIFSNIPADFVHTLSHSPAYRGGLLPIKALKLAKDMLSVSKDAFSKGKIYQEAMRAGVGFNTLSMDANPFEANFSADNRGATKVLSDLYNGLSYLGNSSELTTRLAIFERTKKNAIREFKKNNRGKNPNELVLKEIEQQAAYAARSIMDYSKKGNLADAIGTLVPFFNASIRGLDSTAQSLKNDPVGTLGTYAQLAAGAALLLMYNLSYKDDDDEEAYGKVPMEDKVNNFVIMLPIEKEVDGKKERAYLKIKKTQSVQLLINSTEQNLLSLMGRKKDDKVIGQSFKNNFAIPDNVLSVPSIKVAMALNTGYDEYRDDFVWKGDENVSKPMQYNVVGRNKTDKMLVDVGEKTGMAPVNIELALKQIAASPKNNLYYKIINSGYNQLADGLTEEEKLNYDSNLLNGLGSAFVDKFVRFTYPKKDAGKIDIKKETTRVADKEQKINNDFKIITDLYVNKKYSKNAKENETKLVEKINALIEKSSDIDKYSIAKKAEEFFKKESIKGNTNFADLEIIKRVRTPEVKAMVFVNAFLNKKTDEEKITFINEAKEMDIIPEDGLNVTYKNISLGSGAEIKKYKNEFHYWISKYLEEQSKFEDKKKP